jgi:hypothetical protein
LKRWRVVKTSGDYRSVSGHSISFRDPTNDTG